MKVITNAFWLSFSRTATDLLSFVLFAVISRTFGPAGTGEYSYAFALGTLVALISTSGFEDFGVRQYARAPPRERAQVWQDILLTQSAQLALGVLAFIVFVLAGAVHAGNLIVVLELSVYVVGLSIARTFFVPAMASQSMVIPALTDLCCRLAAIIGALLLTFIGHPSLPWVLAGFPFAGVVLAVLALRNATQHGVSLRVARSWRTVFSTLRGTMPFAGSDILNQFYARADLLLIAYFLGNEKVGLYATDIKFVEVGLLPLILLGSAAYPLLSAYAGTDAGTFTHAARDFARLLFFLTGWLAVGTYYLVPLLIVPLFGVRFAPAVPLLPWIALFALLKGAEATFYRLLYSVHRQTLYCVSLLAGTVLIICLNLALIPTLGLLGAIFAAIISTAAIDVISFVGLAPHVGARSLTRTALSLALALAITVALAAEAHRLSASVWPTAIAACALFPVLGAVVGLVPHPRRSYLLRHVETSETLSRDSHG
jgi:O-antigen/teichoic acid export membrane protein